MSGEVINGSSCGIHGCQRVTITRKGGDMKASIERIGRYMNASIERIGRYMNASVSLVCRASQGSWEYLLVREGEIMLIDGQRVIVKRKK